MNAAEGSGCRIPLVVRPLSATDAQLISGWRYDGPWRVYDSQPDDAPLSAAAGYFAISDAAGDLIGFVCVGAEARIPGLPEDPNVVDVGVGLHPDLVGQGHGATFGRTAITHVERLCGHRPMRAVVQSWNERSLRLTRRLGFREVGRHVATQGGRDVEYVIVVRPAAHDEATA